VSADAKVFHSGSTAARPAAEVHGFVKDRLGIQMRIGHVQNCLSQTREQARKRRADSHLPLWWQADAALAGHRQLAGRGPPRPV
jgi:hypothetical protein